MKPPILIIIAHASIKKSHQGIACNVKQTGLQSVMLSEDPLPEG